MPASMPFAAPWEPPGYNADPLLAELEEHHGLSRLPASPAQAPEGQAGRGARADRALAAGAAERGAPPIAAGGEGELAAWKAWTRARRFAMMRPSTRAP